MELKQTFETAAIHDQWESVYRGNPRQDRFNDQILDRILAHLALPPEASFLDAGCGVGYHTLAIAQRGFRCVGIDISTNILKIAEHRRVQSGLGSRVSFQCQKLENLAFADGQFDVVHCRGVLMHIPEWETALRELCRVLKPGGRMVILEANVTAVETCLARLLRRVRKNRSQMIQTPSGLEFWSEKAGCPFVVRVARIRRLVEQLKDCRVHVVQRFATEFWDINRFRPGAGREAVIYFNRLWFSLRLPAFLSVGNGIIGEKEPAVQPLPAAEGI